MTTRGSLVKPISIFLNPGISFPFPEIDMVIVPVATNLSPDSSCSAPVVIRGFSYSQCLLPSKIHRTGLACSIIPIYLDVTIINSSKITKYIL